MRKFDFITPVVILITFTLTLSPIASAQSGRGRPRVPTRDPAAAPPPPVTVPAATGIAKKEQSGTLSRFALNNGMTVIISEQYATPVAAVAAYFKAGSLDELTTARGVAELLPEVLLAGTASRPAEKLAADLRALGAMVETDVAPDGTTYRLLAQPKKIKEALALQAEIIQRPAFAPADVQAAISRLTLRRQYERDSPPRYGLERLHALAFGQPLTGGAEALRALTREQLEEFYRAHYRPENLLITVVGAVSTFDTLVEIQKLYGEFGAPPEKEGEAGKVAKPAPTKPGQDKAKPAAAPPETKPEAAAPSKPRIDKEQTALRYGAERGDISQPVVSVGFHTPGAQSPEWPALEVLAALIGQGRGSRLHRALVDGQGVASRVEADYLALADAGLLTIQLWPTPDGIDKAESEVFRELDRLRRETPAESDLARAQSLLEKRFLDRTGPYFDRAWALARAEAAQGGHRAMADYRNRIRAVTAEDVQRAAAKYLTLTNTSVHEYEPLAASPRTFDAERFSATVTAWASGFAQPVSAQNVRAADGKAAPPVVSQGREKSADEQAAFESIEPLPVRDFSTLNGPRVFVREDHSQPKVTAAILFQGGRVLEDDANAGITELMLRSMLRGTERRQALEVAHELEQLGAEIEVVNEPEFFGLMVNVLSRNADRALRIARELIEEPAFRDDDMARARLEQVGTIRQERDEGLARSRELLFQALFPGHPNGLPPHGREDALMKLTRDALSQWHARTVKRQFPLVIITGDTEGSALVSGNIADGFRRREVDQKLTVKVARPPEPGEKAEQRRRLTTSLAVGFAGPKGNTSEVAALELIEAVMNGPGGRLAVELGRKEGVAYGTRLDHEALLTAGV
ncbi:MAG TPA: insulinase family protein, partial [Blastocatellia bacterium]|nr:insulinase family protein [Blastocatellia bacterium]